MIAKTNPEFMGFEIRYRGAKGRFVSTIGKAQKIYFRFEKGQWFYVDVSQIKRASEKREFLSDALLQHLDFLIGEAPPPPPPRPKSKIKFKKPTIETRAFKDRDGNSLKSIQLTFELAKKIRFIDAGQMNDSYKDFTLAVKREFDKVRAQYGKNRKYFIRFHQDYKNLESNDANDPNDKRFFGYSPFARRRDSDEGWDRQFRDFLIGWDVMFLARMSAYLNKGFASSETYFEFEGFMIEVITGFRKKKKKKEQDEWGEEFQTS